MRRTERLWYVSDVCRTSEHVVSARADELRGLRARRKIDAVGMLRQTFRKRMTDVR